MNQEKISELMLNIIECLKCEGCTPKDGFVVIMNMLASFMAVNNFDIEEMDKTFELIKEVKETVKKKRKEDKNE